MQLSTEMFFGLFGIVIVVATVWFVRSAGAYNKWANEHYKTNDSGPQ